MKTMRDRRKNLASAGNNRVRQRHKPRFDGADVPSFPEETNRGLIEWPTGKQLSEVSRQLARISRSGIRAEASGDYFKSGELAYQIEEIIRATAELLKKSQRVRE